MFGEIFDVLMRVVRLLTFQRDMPRRRDVCRTGNRQAGP